MSFCFVSYSRLLTVTFTPIASVVFAPGRKLFERHYYAKWLLNHLPLGWNGEFTTPHYFQGMIGCTDGLRLWRGDG